MGIWVFVAEMISKYVALGTTVVLSLFFFFSFCNHSIKVNFPCGLKVNVRWWMCVHENIRPMVSLLFIHCSIHVIYSYLYIVLVRVRLFYFCVVHTKQEEKKIIVSFLLSNFVYDLVHGMIGTRIEKNMNVKYHKKYTKDFHIKNTILVIPCVL